MKQIIDTSTIDGVSVKLGCLDSLFYTMERSLTACMNERFTGELSRLSDLFYILWSEIAETTEAVDKIIEYRAGLNPVLEELRKQMIHEEETRIRAEIKGN